MKAYANATTLSKYVIQNLHQKKFLVGGNVYDGPVPDGTDYIGVTTTNFAIQEQSQNSIPAIALITNSDPMDLSSEACAWMNSKYFVSTPNTTFSSSLSAAGRISILKKLDASAREFGYSLAFPVFYPTCPSQQVYDSLRDYLPMQTSNVYDWILRSGMKGTANVEAYTISRQNDSFDLMPFRYNISTSDLISSGERSRMFWTMMIVILLI